MLTPTEADSFILFTVLLTYLGGGGFDFFSSYFA